VPVVRTAVVVMVTRVVMAGIMIAGCSQRVRMVVDHRRYQGVAMEGCWECQGRSWLKCAVVSVVTAVAVMVDVVAVIAGQAGSKVVAALEVRAVTVVRMAPVVQAKLEVQTELEAEEEEVKQEEQEEKEAEPHLTAAIAFVWSVTLRTCAFKRYCSDGHATEWH
jgi:hypothetical protein